MDMKKIFLIFIVPFVIGAATPTGIYGVWHDREQKSVYFFLQDNHFEYQLELGQRVVTGVGVWRYSNEVHCDGFLWVRCWRGIDSAPHPMT
jgi:hypothetical protein